MYCTLMWMCLNIKYVCIFTHSLPHTLSRSLCLSLSLSFSLARSRYIWITLCPLRIHAARTVLFRFEFLYVVFVLFLLRSLFCSYVRLLVCWFLGLASLSLLKKPFTCVCTTLYRWADRVCVRASYHRQLQCNALSKFDRVRMKKLHRFSKNSKPALFFF